MNVLSHIPVDMKTEVFDTLLFAQGVRIERILSKGHTSPEFGWYDQASNEWVLVIQGGGVIAFADGREVVLKAGDYYHIPAHVRHKVIWTDPDDVTIWLAVFYDSV